MKIVIVTTMRNEVPHALEWLAHHRAAGVSDFLIYTNDCSDGTEVLLDAVPYVTRIGQQSGNKPPQWRALKAAWEHPLVESADWLACIDCDEFINLGNGLGDIPDLISAAESDAIQLPWRLFGNSAQIDTSDALTTERFSLAAPENLIYPPLGSFFKTLFRRAGPFRQFGVHRPKQKKRHAPVWCNGSGQKVEGRASTDDSVIMAWGAPIARELVQLNHYSLRSAAEFMLKRDRGLPNHRKKEVDLTYWAERNFNTVEDRSILSMCDATKAELKRLRDISEIADREAAGRDWHRQRLEEILTDPENLKLFGRLCLLPGSTPPDEARALRLVRRYQTAHGG